MRALLIGTAIVVASAAFAHQGVKNPAVLERMNAMKAIGDQMKVLGTMAKAPASFDAAQAQAALSLISLEAGRSLTLFEAEEDDPKSEARPEIWENFSDFSEKMRAMQAAANNADTSSIDGVQPALQSLGATCKTCHQIYRE